MSATLQPAVILLATTAVHCQVGGGGSGLVAQLKYQLLSRGAPTQQCIPILDCAKLSWCISFTLFSSLIRDCSKMTNSLCIFFCNFIYICLSTLYLSVICTLYPLIQNITIYPMVFYSSFCSMGFSVFCPACCSYWGY